MFFVTQFYENINYKSVHKFRCIIPQKNAICREFYP